VERRPRWWGAGAVLRSRPIHPCAARSLRLRIPACGMIYCAAGRVIGCCEGWARGAPGAAGALAFSAPSREPPMTPVPSPVEFPCIGLLPG